ncbi:hypothetical protein B7494_g3529 [Chlorociboria aeruginascens]|nr:hypothetical protein B7494_g3529 [Chlorociboria aeruginascens]
MHVFPSTILLLAAGALALPASQAARNVTIDSSLVPHFSIVAGSGIGAGGVAIPKTCPPARQAFIDKLSTNVANGNVLGTKISFNANPQVQDTNTNKLRATAMIITLQSFSGVKGVGCPGTSTPELLTQQKTGVVSS